MVEITKWWSGVDLTCHVGGSTRGGGPRGRDRFRLPTARGQTAVAVCAGGDIMSAEVSPFKDLEASAICH